LTSKSSLQYEIQTELPIEFNEKSFMIWKLANFAEKSFDGIIGQNLLKPLGAVLDNNNDCLIVNNNKIKFLYSCPYNEDEIYQLEVCSMEENDLSKLYENLQSDEEKRLKKLINSYKDLFFKEGDQLTCTTAIQHEIVTTTDRPIFSKIYRYPHVHEEEISKQIHEMLEQGIIQESNSPYNSPLWIVPKKMDNSGKKKWRIVIDYRNLNQVTEEDKFPIPNIDGILDKLGRAQYFTTLDLAKGFHQILVREEDRKKTAFSTPLGHYEYVRMPFGLKNAPATFQRLMNTILKDYINKICVVYLDDVLIFSTSLEEHLQSIKKIFDTLRKWNLKVQFDKCNFLSRETEYLGHILTPEGVKPNPKKIETIKNLNLPGTQKQIKSFLGITGYYRKFVKDYAKVAQPLTKYLKKGMKVNTNDPSYIQAFEKLKRIITESPVLKYPDYKKKFQLVTDASDFAIGAVLQQDEHPICFASRTLNEHERNYSTTEKELLAIFWSVNYFRPYIYGAKFDLLTDHQPLKWLFVKTKGKDANQRLQRWVLRLAEYNINVDYIKGKENNVADFLSRINTETNEINLVQENREEDLRSEASMSNNVDENEDQDTIHSQEE